MNRFAGSASEAYYMDSLNELIFEFTSVWLLIKYREAEGVLVRKKRELNSWEGMREGHAVHTAKFSTYKP